MGLNIAGEQIEQVSDGQKRIALPHVSRATALGNDEIRGIDLGLLGKRFHQGRLAPAGLATNKAELNVPGYRLP